MKKITTPLSTLKAIILLLLLSTSAALYAQPIIQWQKCLGGAGQDFGYSTKPTNDGGYIMIGDSKSNDADVSGHHGTNVDSSDMWVVKTDASGSIQWQRSFGGSAWDFSSEIIQTNDSGYIFTGIINSSDGDAVGKHLGADAWVVKLDASGNIQWQKCLGGDSYDYGKTIKQTSDGGYIVGAETSSTNGDVSGNHGMGDLWLVKLDATGTIEWQKCYGGSAIEGHSSIHLNGLNLIDQALVLTNDGGYLLTGSACSNDGDITNHHGSTAFTTPDMWVLKLDATGTIQWQTSLGGSASDKPQAALQTADGGYIVTGNSSSIDGDVTGVQGNTDIWIVKLDPSGAISWTKTYGGTSSDLITSMNTTNDGGYFIAGSTMSPNNGSVAGNHGSRDAWILKLDANGILQWQKCLGGSTTDIATYGKQTSDGGYIVGGWAGSINYDVTGTHNQSVDYWLVKLAPVATNTIRGTIFEDLNANCIKDSGEIGLPGKIVKAMPGNYYASTDINGNYTLFVDSGSYSVSHTPPAFYTQSCPSGPVIYSVTINSSNPNSYSNDFGDTLTSHCSNLKISMGTWTLRRCFKNTYGISYSNTGAIPVTNATVSVTLDPELIFISSTIPYTLVGNQYVFNVGTLNSGQSGHFSITDSVSCATVLGTTKCVTAIITIDSTECDSLNNIVTDCHTVVGSCDPNSLQVASQIDTNGYVTQEDITASDTLTYLINFQNVGSDTAFTVIVRDTLSDLLEGTSIELGASSHTYTFRIYGQGICEWTFNNILLPDSTTNELSSHGFVKFSIQQTPGNTPGTIINNGAAIWFDYNEFLPTNSTTNMIPLAVNITSISISDKVTLVYPNPFSTSTTISVNEKLQNAELVVYDITGKEVKVMKNLNGNNISVDRNNLTNGIYLYRILQNNKFIASGKLIIE